MIYHIKKNNHYCEETRVQAHDGKSEYSVKCKIPAEWLTNFNNKKLNLQSSKIQGQGFSLDHHRDSVRTSFRPVFEADGLTPKGFFGILAYYYNHGKCYQKFLFNVSEGEEFEYSYKMDRLNNTITWTSPKLKKPKVFPFDWNGVPTWGMTLYPYAGGDFVAPVDLTIEVDII